MTARLRQRRIREPRGATAGRLPYLRLLLVASVAVPALLFVVAAHYERAHVLRDAEGDAVAGAEILREHVLRVVETHELLLRQLDRRIQGMSWDQIRATATELSAEMAAMHADMPEVSNLGLTDAQGRMWAASMSRSHSGYASVTNLEVWSAQREADQGTYITRAYIGPTTGRLNFGISRRRTTADGSFDGTIHVGVAADYFTNFWQAAVRGKYETAVSLVRTDGEMLARFPEKAGPPQRLSLENSPLMQHLRAGAQSGVYRQLSTIDSVERIYAYERVGDYPLVVGYGVSVSLALTTWRQDIMMLASICALSAVALVVAVLSAMRQVRLLVEEKGRREAVEKVAQEGYRLEILGQLAAGVAHDFTNIVHVVRSGARLIQEDSNDQSRVRFLAQMLGETAERAGMLTQRMLAFARLDHDGSGHGEDAEDGVVDPAEAISGVCELLSSTLGPCHPVRCEMNVKELPALVRGDHAGLEAAVLNLAVNARDAMPDGGDVVIRAVSERVGNGGGRRHQEDSPSGLAPALYVRVSVTDTGGGMPPEVLAHAGEPFFTTKPPGKGTGLGLAGARGFAARAGGILHIESVVGRGTCVTLWLPAITDAPPDPHPRTTTGHGTGAMPPWLDQIKA